MSSSIQTKVNPIGEFQAHFGVLPGTQDAKTDCTRWEQLCGELLAERERLRSDLERAVIEVLCKDVDLNLTMEQIYSEVDQNVPIEQVIEQLAAEVERSN